MVYKQLAVEKSMLDWHVRCLKCGYEAVSLSVAVGHFLCMNKPLMCSPTWFSSWVVENSAVSWSFSCRTACGNAAINITLSLAMFFFCYWACQSCMHHELSPHQLGLRLLSRGSEHEA